MFCVFQQSKDSDFTAIDVGDPSTVEEVESLLKPHGWNGQNWFGSGAKSEADAIQEAKLCKFEYRSAEEMADLRAKLKQFI